MKMKTARQSYETSWANTDSTNGSFSFLSQQNHLLILICHMQIWKYRTRD